MANSHPNTLAKKEKTGAEQEDSGELQLARVASSSNKCLVSI